VLCVGNYHSGGAGKTPTVLALAKLLRDLGEMPVVLSRGYGGKLRGPVKVDPEPASSGRCRRRAADAGARCRWWFHAIAPTAFRWPIAGGHRDPDGRRLSESGRRQGCFADRDRRPSRARQRAGVSRWPLRAPLRAANRAHRRADHCRQWHLGRRVAATIAAQGKPVLRAQLVPDEATVASLRGKRVLAFAGIGDPARFFNTLQRSGIEVVRERAFADHHAFSKAEIESLVAESNSRRIDAGDDGKGSGTAGATARVARIGKGTSRRSR
jgi:tetraacyldisaccharide 4'-kinase